MPDSPTHLTTEEAAAYLRVSPETLRFWRKNDRGPKGWKLGRRVFYAVTDLDDFLAAARAVEPCLSHGDA